MSRWAFDPVVLATLPGLAVPYTIGVARLWRVAGRGHGTRTWQVVCYAAGLLSVIIALLSPVATVSEILFSMHMTQHEILILVSAPLLVLARPLAPSLWGLPQTWRARAVRWTQTAAWRSAWRRISGPLVVWIIHGLALWVWHLPALYQAALASRGVHAVMHVAFLGSASLFWWALVHGRYGRLGYGVAALFVFATALHSEALGALLTFATSTWYPAYAQRAAAAGVDALADQQLAGLLMWVPFGMVFLITGLALFTAWLGEAARRAGGPPRALLLLIVLLSAGGLACNGDRKRHAEEISRGDADRGRQTISRFGCGTCHAIPGVPAAAGRVGPPLEHVASRKYLAGRLINEPAAMIDWLRDPQAHRSPTAMPNLGLSEQEARDVAAYLYTLD